MKYKVIKFGAPWCGPCRALETKLKGFDKCEIVRYDVDDADTVLGTVDIVFHFGVPTFRLMSKMTSRFEQIFDCERHFSVPPFFFTVLFHRIFTFFDPASHPCCYSVMHASGWFGGG